MKPWRHLIESDVEIRKLERRAYSGDENAIRRLARIKRRTKERRYSERDIKPGMVIVDQVGRKHTQDLPLLNSVSQKGDIWRVLHTSHSDHFDGVWELPDGTDITVRGKELLLVRVSPSSSRRKWVFCRPHSLAFGLNSGVYYVALGESVTETLNESDAQIRKLYKEWVATQDKYTLNTLLQKMMRIEKVKLRQQNNLILRSINKDANPKWKIERSNVFIGPRDYVFSDTSFVLPDTHRSVPEQISIRTFTHANGNRFFNWAFRHNERTPEGSRAINIAVPILEANGFELDPEI